MGQELSQLWNGATQFAGQGFDLAKDTAGTIGNDIVGGAKELGSGIYNAPGDFSKALGLGQGVSTIDQGVSATQNNPSALANAAESGAKTAASPLPSAGSFDVTKLNAPASFDAANPSYQLAQGVTPTADGAYAAMTSGAAPDAASVPSMGGLGQGGGGVAAAPYQPGDFYSNLTRATPSSDLMTTLSGETLKSTPDTLAAALSQISSGAPQVGPAAAAGTAGAASAAPHSDLLHQIIGAHGENIPKELMAGLTGLNMYNASRANAAQEKMIKSQLNTAEQQQALQQNKLNSAQAGYVPSEMQSAIDLAENQAEAAIRSKYAAAGQSGTSGEMADIAAARTQAALQRFQESQQMVDQSAKILSNYNSEVSNYMKSLIENQTAQDQMFQGALGDFFTEMGLQRPATTTTH